MLTNPAGLIYGTLVVATLLDAETARGQTYPRSTAAVVVAMILYWVGHTYSSFTGERLESGEPLRLSALAVAARRDLSVLLGGAVPLAVELFCWGAGVTLADGLTASVWTAGVVVAGLEVAAAIRTERKGRELAAQIAAGLGLMLLVILLRRLLH